MPHGPASPTQDPGERQFEFGQPCFGVYAVLAVVPRWDNASTTATGAELMAEMTWQSCDLSIRLETKPSRHGYQQVVVSVTRGGFSAARESLLDAGDIARFAGQVHRMWQDLAGTAELLGEHGIEFSLKLTATGGGHVDIHVDISQPWANLRIEAQTDQTFLPALHDGLLAIR
jgi:hypothetical protein